MERKKLTSVTLEHVLERGEGKLSVVKMLLCLVRVKCVSGMLRMVEMMRTWGGKEKHTQTLELNELAAAFLGLENISDLFRCHSYSPCYKDFSFFSLIYRRVALPPPHVSRRLSAYTVRFFFSFSLRKMSSSFGTLFSSNNNRMCLKSLQLSALLDLFNYLFFSSD